MIVRKTVLLISILLLVLLLAGCGKPGAPVITSAVAGDSTVKVTWSAVSDATGYKLYQATTKGGSYAYTGQSTQTGNNLEATGLTNGTTYYFVVTAVKGSTESAYSNEISATPVDVPDIQDDFESYGATLAAPWTRILGVDCAVETDATSGSKALHNGLTSTGYVHSGVSTKDALIAARLRATNSSTDSTTLILFGRYIDVDNYFCCQFDKTNRKIWLLKVESGGSAVLASAALPDGFDFAAYHTLEFELAGTALNGYVDGQLLVTATDTETAVSGQAGIGILNGEGYADDFKVYYR